MVHIDWQQHFGCRCAARFPHCTSAVVRAAALCVILRLVLATTAVRYPSLGMSGAGPGAEGACRRYDIAAARGVALQRKRVHDCAHTNEAYVHARARMRRARDCVNCDG